MKTGPVAYYDGKVSTRREALLTLEGEQLILTGEDFRLAYPLNAVRIPPAVGAIRRSVRLPDGGLCELNDTELLAALEARLAGAGGWRLLHRWEKSLPLALTALALTAPAVLLFVRFGLPFLAHRTALALPPASEQRLGSESLATLDRFLMKPSTLSQERRDQLTTLFRKVAGPEAEAAGYRLEFRSSPAIGANAFALPSGIVVVTDGLVELARQDDEIAAVLAHELGHVRGRHILRHVLQSSATGLIVATLTGDVTSITSLAATLPTVLVDASFSREFEREADDAAIAWMRSSGMQPRRYAEFLGRMQAQADLRHGETNGGMKKASSYLSTHPDTGERIRHILRAAGE